MLVTEIGNLFIVSKYLNSFLNRTSYLCSHTKDSYKEFHQTLMTTALTISVIVRKFFCFNLIISAFLNS